MKLQVEQLQDGRFAVILSNTYGRLSGYMDQHRKIRRPKVLLAFPPSDMLLFDKKEDAEQAIADYQKWASGESTKPIEERDNLNCCRTCYLLLARIKELKK